MTGLRCFPSCPTPGPGCLATPTGMLVYRRSRTSSPCARPARLTTRSAPTSAWECKVIKAQLGIAPIAWWNDDLEELSDDVSLEECLRQARAAGFTGMETAPRFPWHPALRSPSL